MGKRKTIMINGSDEALEAEMMKRSDVDLLKTMYVQRILCTKMLLNGKPPVLKISYFCEFEQHAKEVLFFENTGFARTKARQWWGLFSTTEPPNTIDEALARVNEVCGPSAILVRINTKYPEIIKYGMSPSIKGVKSWTIKSLSR